MERSIEGGLTRRQKVRRAAGGLSLVILTAGSATGVAQALGRDGSSPAVAEPDSLDFAFSSGNLAGRGLSGSELRFTAALTVRGAQERAYNALMAGGMQAAKAIAEQRAAESARAARHSSSGSQPSSNGDFLACVKNRESRGDYTIHNAEGSGASGAYQFMPGTWNTNAEAAGRPDLVGVDPAAASPDDQDAMAQALYARQGAQPWGGSC